MSLQFTLPTPLVDDLPEWAMREGVSVQDHARLVLGLTSALLDPSRDSPLHLALAAVFADRSLDVERVAETLREILRSAVRTMQTGNPAEGLPPFASLLLEKSGVDPTYLPKTPRPSLLGKFAHLGISSDEYALEKQAELDREEARATSYRS